MDTKVTVVPGQRIRVIAPYSEVCCHMKIAGKPMYVELIKREYADWTGYTAQFYKLTGEIFSSPVTTGEGGIHWDEESQTFYIYPDDGPGDAYPKEVQRELTERLKAALGGSEVKVITDLGLG